MNRERLDRSSEIDRVLEEDIECEVDDSDADPDFELHSDHDTESEFGIDIEEADNNVDEEVGGNENVDDETGGNEESGNTEGNLDLPSTSPAPVRRRRAYFLGKDKKLNGKKVMETQMLEQEPRTLFHYICLELYEKPLMSKTLLRLGPCFSMSL